MSEARDYLPFRWNRYYLPFPGLYQAVCTVCGETVMARTVEGLTGPCEAHTCAERGTR